MAKPFVSHDGTDANGVRAEVWVQTGTGTVKELSESGRNVLVKMNVEGLKHPVQGWTAMDENIYPLLVEAHEQGREVAYRIESQRKPGVDRSTPIGELRQTQEIANQNTRSLFVGIDGTLSSEAVTNPAEDPHTGGRIPATGRAQAPAPAAPTAGGGFSADQALTGLANARQGGLDPAIVNAAAALALAAGASVEQVLTAGVDPQAAPERRPQRRAVAKEAAPYVAYNTDGRVNLGSYMVQAAVGAESLAAELLRRHAEQEAARHNAAVAAGEAEGPEVEPQPVNFKSAAALGAVLLDLADQVQVNTVGGGRPDRMGTSHTRARGLVYDAVEHRHPVPFGQGQEAQDAWREAIVEEATSRFRFAAQIAVPGEPQTAPQEAQAAQGQPETPAGQDAAGQVADEAVVERFKVLAQQAGFTAEPGSPIARFLSVKFGVQQVRRVPAQTLEELVSWFEAQENPAEKFHHYVLREAGATTNA